ncbi:putative Fe-S protein PflX [Archaeoglobus sulfaticallidus PM70-1]|uniref:Putative Fe-S protein PflX n=1 Tax=Archaeoglobus sulfaticallidus PM70-1 TaxID=387631 RepID=N0BPF4_9EURY|nr:radical SAM protein [Archaeoglobus sulfaticallidus]AGK62245.1 putative Fe-S protein PflX [Archaeoglobus sulfaticallidus PM70-1]
MSLERYEQINSGRRTAKFQIVKRIDVSSYLESDLSLKELLKVHSEVKREFKELIDSIDMPKIPEMPEKTPQRSFLWLKIKILEEMLKECNFCEKRCGVNRYEKLGYCKCGVKSYYTSEFLHMGEEPELIPSHTIFFNRCTFRCVFCQNFDIVYSDNYPVDEIELARSIDRRYRQGSRNVNFVGGNPDQHAHTILRILQHVESNIAVVWNSNMYHSEELAEIIEDVVDVWLGDFKYGNDRCALKYSKAKNYWRVVTRNFRRAENNGELLIRHLVMPEHIECCTKRIVGWVAEELKPGTRFNLMFQYYPTFRAYEYPEISRRLNREEIQRALDIAKRYRLNLV